MVDKGEVKGIATFAKLTWGRSDWELAAVSADSSGKLRHVAKSLGGQLVPDPTLNPAGQFITPSAADLTGLFAPAGMTFDNLGNLWVSNFANVGCPSNPSDLTTSCARLNEYNSTGVFMRSIQFPVISSAPFGLALGPDNNIYASEFLAGKVAKIDVAATVSCVTGCDFITGPPLSRPKYLSFTEIDCRVYAPGFIEVCKSSSITNPVTGDFTFNSPAFPNLLNLPPNTCLSLKLTVEYTPRVSSRFVNRRRLQTR